MTGANAITVVKPAQGYIAGNIALPGSKSLTNRALVVAAQSNRAFTIDNASDSEDSAVVLRFLQSLGYGVAVKDSTWTVSPQTVASGDNETIHIDLHEAGTAMRFITAFCCTCNGTFVLTGTERLRQRPIAPLVTALQQAGADIQYEDKQGFLPIRIRGNGAWRPAQFTVAAGESSQFVTALLLLAPRLTLGCTVRLAGALASEPYVRMTVGLLQSLGIAWQSTDAGYRLERNTVEADGYLVESDWSAASYLLGLAATIKADVTLRHLRADSLQGDAAQLAIFRQWGLNMEWVGTDALNVTNPTGALLPRPLNFDFSPMPDLAQTFAVLAASANGSSRFTGLHTLPLKETNRLQALVTELAKLGIGATATEESLFIEGGTLQTPIQSIGTYNDHRMAMSFAVAANLLGRTTIEAPQVVRKSYPRFWDDLATLGYALH
jgi:3-phosphoshikimate 1-carboxyvinyltransferase